MVYLRLMSFGDYTGRNWKQAESYGGWLDGTYSMNYLPGMLLQKTGWGVSDIQIEFLGGDYVLPYYLIGGEYDYEIQMSDILYQGDVSKVIDLQYSVYDYVSDGKPSANAGAYAAEEMAYRSFVQQNYTFVPGSTRAIRPEDAIKQYDGTPLYADTVVGYGGENAYYFRELLQEGYTYTAEFSGSQTEIGTSSSRITEFQLYAPDGSRETRIRFRYGLGELTVVEEMVVTVRPYSLQKYYDGTPLRYGTHDYTVSGLPSGYQLELSLDSIYLVDAGVLDESVVQSLPYTVTDRSGNDVTDEFVIHYEMANSFMVSRRKITIATMSESKIYDGTPLTSSGYWISRGTLADGDEITVRTGGSITDVGKVFNTVSEITVYNSRSENVTCNYEIVVSEGILEIVAD